MTRWCPAISRAFILDKADVRARIGGMAFVLWYEKRLEHPCPDLARRDRIACNERPFGTDNARCKLVMIKPVTQSVSIGSLAAILERARRRRDAGLLRVPKRAPPRRLRATERAYDEVDYRADGALNAIPDVRQDARAGGGLDFLVRQCADAGDV